MKKANALSCASTFDRLKMPFTAATSGSTSEVMNPQATNNVVTEANAPVALLWVGMRLSTELASVIVLRSGGPGGAAGRAFGSASCRERVCQYVLFSVVAVSFIKYFSIFILLLFLYSILF